MNKDVVTGIKCSFGILGFISIYIGLGYVIQAITPPEKIWQDQFKTSRMPAQAGPLGNVEFGILKDYFTLDDHGKKLRFDIEFQVRTGDDDYFGIKAKKAVSEALINTFMIRDKSKEDLIARSLLSIAKQEFMASFMKNFVKTITFYKLIDRDIQIDFKFIPTKENPQDYSYELSTNHLLNISNTDKLFPQITGKNKRIINQVATQKREPNHQRYQYAGGAISIWVKVLDSLLPGTQEHAVKGMVRYRRYFIDHEPANHKIHQEQEEVLANQLIFARTDSVPFLTVDVIKKFNVKSLIPSLDKMIVYPGYLVEPDLYKEGIVEDLLSPSTKPIKAGELQITGSVKSSSQKYNYNLHLKKLVFDFATKTFDTNQSDTLADIKNFPTNTNDTTLKQNLGMKIRGVILREYKTSLIEALELARFHKNVGGAQ